MPRLQTCLDAAEREAMRDGSPEIGTHHQLIGLFHEGVASVAMEKLGLRVEAVRSAAHDLFPPSAPSSHPPPSSAEAQGSLGRAAWLARGRSSNYLGTEHILYAIAFDPGSRARRVLNHLDTNLTELKKELACFIEGPRQPRRRRKWAAERVCSFCAKRRLDDDHLIAGPGVWICEECVRLCTEILSEEQGRGPKAI